MKLRDKAKQVEGLVEGMPQYKEPEEEKKWEKGGGKSGRWERKGDSTKKKDLDKRKEKTAMAFNLKPASNRDTKDKPIDAEEKKEESSFKLNLKPVTQRFNSWRGKKCFEKVDSDPSVTPSWKIQSEKSTTKAVDNTLKKPFDKDTPKPVIPAWKRHKNREDSMTPTSQEGSPAERFKRAKATQNCSDTDSPQSLKKTEKLIIRTGGNDDHRKMSVIPVVEEEGMHKKVKRSKSLQPQKRIEKYVIKTINFVAIKVLVEEEEEVFTEEEVEEIKPRSRSVRKVSPVSRVPT